MRTPGTPDLIVAGAGMAGLVAAAHARQRGASVVVYEKGTRAGGSMLLSSGFVWRYRELEEFRAQCSGGDPELQRLVHERLDSDTDWLESLGAPVRVRETGNPLTLGRRFRTDGLTGALERAAGDVRLGEPLEELPRDVPVILATGGFPASRELIRRHITPWADHLRLRANPWSTGDGLRLGLQAGATLTGGMDEFYGRNLPAPPARLDAAGLVPLAQLYAHHAIVENDDGERYVARNWSEIDVVQWTARQPHARARYIVSDEALGKRVRERTVREMIEAARTAGGPVRRETGRTVVEVTAGITTTLGGLKVDSSARAADGVFACGTDAGGISTGGYFSGLAAGLVMGRIGADAALGS